MKNVILQFKGHVEKIPKGDHTDPEFVAWCEQKGIQIYGGDRRGWYGAANTCLRDAAYILELEVEGFLYPVLLTEAEYQAASVSDNVNNSNDIQEEVEKLQREINNNKQE